MNLHFIARTINCVCDSKMSMFRVLGICNFDKGMNDKKDKASSKPIPPGKQAY